jgi:hypothetical protein
MRFTIRDLLWLTVVVALALTFFYVNRPTASGRFQFVIDSNGTKYVIDTTNGQILHMGDHTNGKWMEYPSPSLSKR